MKLSELKPCAKCGGPLPPIWRVVRVSIAALDRRATEQVLGMTQMLGNSGQALAIAEVMAPGAEDAVMIAGDKDASLWTEIHLCQNCVMSGPLDLAMLIEKADES